MRKPNTTFDLYVGGNLPPAAPDVAGLTGYIQDQFVRGTESTEFRRKGADRQFTWVATIEVGLNTPSIPDAYPGAPSQTTIWVPDQNGTPYTVLFVERERRFRGADFLRVYLSKGSIVAIEVKEADGNPDLLNVVTLIFDQADGFKVSQPAANQARINFTDTHKVLNSAADTTADYLSSKLAAGSFMSVVTTNPGGNEELLVVWNGRNYVRRAALLRGF